MEDTSRWRAIATKGKLSKGHNTYLLELAMKRNYHSPELDRIFSRIVKEYGFYCPILDRVFLDRKYIEGIEPAFELYLDKYVAMNRKIIELVGGEEECNIMYEIAQEA